MTHLGLRPLKLVRHVRGATAYHKGPLPPLAPGVRDIRIQKRGGGEGIRVWIDDLKGLLGLVDMGVVEVHPWNATIDDIECADLMVFDLDSGPDVEWSLVQGTARCLRARPADTIGRQLTTALVMSREGEREREILI